jgi:predicted TIM-barrel fold metal-dependent hydrolase
MEPPVTDVHVHLLPARLAAAVRGFFDEHLPVPLAYPLEPTVVLDRLAAAGITVACTLPYAHRAGVAAGLNAGVAALCAEHADHGVTLLPGCTAHPEDPSPGEDVGRAVAAGARVVKLHCSVGRFEPDDARLDAVHGVAGDLGVPVLVHAGHAVDGTTGAGDLTPLGTAARRHPRTTFVLAHLGAPAEEAAIALMRARPNVWADLTPVIDRPVALDPTDAEALSDRLLFGSDAPNVALDAAASLCHLRGLGLSRPALEAITSANATRLLAVAGRGAPDR